MERTNKKLSLSEAKLKIASYCAYQERCQQEIRDKLYSYGLIPDDVEELIGYLISEGYLNELRFSKAYCGGKFRIKKWGRNRITLELKKRKISDNCIRIGLQEIDEEDYIQVIQSLINSKRLKYDNLSDYVKRNKIASFLISKGYESQITWEQLNRMFP